MRSLLAKYAVGLPLALTAGACAGLWDMSDATLESTLAMLLVSGLGLGLLLPRHGLAVTLSMAAGVLLANLLAPEPPAVNLGEWDRAWISASVAALPALAGAIAGTWLAAGAARLGWRVTL